MAIRPEEAAYALDEQISRQVIALENQIDEELEKRHYTGGPPVTVGISSNLHEKAIQEVVRRFQSAGWKVKVESDQRDGSWLEFSTQ